MVKTTVKIDGMMCGHCEAHVNETVRNNFKVKKVTSSHADGVTEIISESPIDETKLREKIGATGYKVLDVTSKEEGKKGFSFFKK